MPLTETQAVAPSDVEACWRRPSVWTVIRRPRRALMRLAKAGLATLPLAVAVVLLSSCAGGGDRQASTSPEISLQGAGFPKMEVGSPPSQRYVVRLRVRNSGKDVLVFDKAEQTFITGQGEFMRCTFTCPTCAGGRMELQPGEEHTLANCETTEDLSGAAGGGLLFFDFTLFLQESVVAGPYRAPLPEPGSPDWAREGGVPLEFKDPQGRPVSAP